MPDGNTQLHSGQFPDLEDVGRPNEHCSFDELDVNENLPSGKERHLPETVVLGHIKVWEKVCATCSP